MTAHNLDDNLETFIMRKKEIAYPWDYLQSLKLGL